MSTDENTELLQKPLLIFDGDCGFCRLWITRWKEITGEAVDYAPYQAVAPRFPKIPMDSFRRSVQLVTSDGVVMSGAEAVFSTLAAGGKTWPLLLYYRLPGFRLIAEPMYRLIAANRTFFSRVTQLLWGKHVNRPTYLMATQLYRRGLAVVYAIAFISLGRQVVGLYGANGVLPMGPYLNAVKEQVAWYDQLRLVPSIFWISHADIFLQVVCAVGAVLAVALFLGWAPRVMSLLLWALYLSFVAVGRDFLRFQWDVLLLEAGFLSIFLTPQPSGLVVWLLHWLNFRLIFSSGMVKWMSGDASWHNFTALTYHYYTQPLPTWIAWYMNQLPLWFQKFSTGLVLAVEVFVPFLIFAPRRLRHAAAITLLALQGLIFLTGNYCFFNLLAATICLFLFDDTFWNKRARIKPARAWPRWVLAPVAAVILISTSVQTTAQIGWNVRWNGVFQFVTEFFMPFHSANSYGLFAVMTTSRPEIVLEGSLDGKTWIPYEFKYKPGDVNRRPRFVAPHQPRLDWQMWFAALGDYRQNPWLVNVCLRLLQGSASVTNLLKTNPFEAAPPMYVRAVLYDYTFTTRAEKKESGAWWKREERGLYLPAIGLKKAS